MPSQKLSELYDTVVVRFGKSTGERADLDLLAKHFGLMDNRAHTGALARKILREYLRNNRELIERLRSVE